MKIEIDNRNRQAKNDRQLIVGDNRYITNVHLHVILSLIKFQVLLRIEEVVAMKLSVIFVSFIKYEF
jgi:hypothetical protein